VDGPGYVVVGRLLRPHGVRGEVRMHPETDFPERLAGLRDAVLLKAGQPTPVRVEHVRPHGAQMLVKLVGVDTVEAAREWVGSNLAVPRAEVPPPPAGRHYVFDIIGLRVQTDSGEVLGTVTEVLRTKSNDVYVVQGSGRRYLIPAISSVVLTIDVAGGAITVRPLAGMLE
jgi:16S rRNA processing protein RimM